MPTDYFAVAAELARKQAQSPYRDEPEPFADVEWCIWCHQVKADPRHFPYCLPACANCAEAD